MSALGDAVQIAAPQTRVAALAARLAAILLLAVVAGFAIWWFFVRPAGLKTEAAQARAGEKIQEGAAKAGADAVKITVDVNQHKAGIDAVTQGNQYAISHAQGAAAPIDPALARALHDALCLRDAYQHEPDCPAVPSLGGSVGPVEGHSGGEPAAE